MSRHSREYCRDRTNRSPADRQTLGFQAEVRQLPRVMIQSLFSTREIFLP
jgi:hypothetical protein